MHLRFQYSFFSPLVNYKSAKDEAADLVIAPEYACPWVAIEQTIQNGVIPPTGSIWIVGCESITPTEVTGLAGRLGDLCVVIVEQVLIGNRQFCDPVVFLFRTVSTNGASKNVLLIQYKTEPMADREKRLEANRLILGERVYRFCNTQEPSIRLVTLLCSDTLRLAAGDQLAAELSDSVNTVLIHLQLNEKPRDPVYSQFRYMLLRQQRRREIVAVNWAKGTRIREIDGTVTTIGESASCIFMQSEHTNCNRDRIAHNHARGLYSTYLATCRAYALFFNFDAFLFSYSSTKADQEGALPQERARHGPEMRDIYRFDEAATSWTSCRPAPDRCDQAFRALDPSYLVSARADPLNLERLFLLSCGRVASLPDTPNNSSWPRLDTMESFRLAENEGICRLTFAQDQSPEAVKYRDKTLIPRFRIFEQLRKDPSVYPLRMDSFKRRRQ